MQLDRIAVVLRPRSSWEAMELGSALLRRHAGVVWRAWCLASLPLWIVLLLLAWLVDGWPLLLMSVLLWWLKPLYDRIPLHVLSRAAFGDVPGVRESALACVRLGREQLFADLTWRRVGLNRALTLPIALLEGVRGERLAARKRAIHGHGGSVGAALTLLCLHFEMAIVSGLLLLAPMFVPVEYLSESTRAAYALLSEQPPDWLWVLLAGMLWVTYGLIEPFYIAAGFGIYLNSRVHLEAWDIELAFRRMGARLRALAQGGVLVLALLWLLPMAPASAAEPAAESAPAGQAEAASGDAVALDAVFKPTERDAAFQNAVDQAYRDPLLRPRQMQPDWTWRGSDKKRDKRSDEAPADLGWLSKLLSGGFGLMAEVVMWCIVASCLIALLWFTRHWWSTLLERRPPAPEPEPVDEAPAPHVERIPDDVAAAVRALWTQGRPRAALALLYRAAVQVMATRVQTELPPGATEAQCLRLSRRLSEFEDRDAFTAVVRAWQYAAYAQRLPDGDRFDALLRQASARFGWRA